MFNDNQLWYSDNPISLSKNKLWKGETIKIICDFILEQSGMETMQAHIYECNTSTIKAISGNDSV